MSEAEEDEGLGIWEESRMATDLIAGQVAMLRTCIPFDRLIEAYEKADAVGCIFDPSGYIKHADGIRKAKKIVAATRRWVREVEEAVGAPSS